MFCSRFGVICAIPRKKNIEKFKYVFNVEEANTTHFCRTELNVYSIFDGKAFERDDKLDKKDFVRF